MERLYPTNISNEQRNIFERYCQSLPARHPREHQIDVLIRAAKTLINDAWNLDSGGIVAISDACQVLGQNHLLTRLQHVDAALGERKNIPAAVGDETI